jgi:hypothetical protein
MVSLRLIVQENLATGDGQGKPDGLALWSHQHELTGMTRCRIKGA